tara:strand:- start:9454 stop:9858 length:405 start_codon:yes stop_codon:yes gene_type:complete
MNSKGFKSIFFIIILITSKVGLAINVHYCCGKIHEISMAWDAKGCQMQPIADHLGFVVKKNHCCNNERVYVQNNTPQKIVDLSYDLNLPILNYDEKGFFFKEKIYLNQKKNPRNHFLISKGKIFLFNSALVFYG